MKIEQHHQRRKKQPSQLQLGLHETLGQSDVGYESTRSKYTVGGTRSNLNNLYRACSRFQTLHVIAVALDAARFDAIHGEHATQDKWGKFNAPQELGGRLTRTPTPISRTPLFHSLMRNRSFALYCTNFCYINYFRIALIGPLAKQFYWSLFSLVITFLTWSLDRYFSSLSNALPSYFWYDIEAMYYVAIHHWRSSRFEWH